MNKNYGYGYMNDSEISKVSGGLSTKKVILGVTAGVAALAAVAYGVKVVYNVKGRDMDTKDAFKFWKGNFWKSE